MWNDYADQGESPTTGLQYPTGPTWSADYVQIGGVAGKNSTYSGGNPVTGQQPANNTFSFTGANHIVDLFGWIDNVEYDQSDASQYASTFTVAIYDNSGDLVDTITCLSADDEDNISAPNDNPYYWVLGTNGRDPEPNEKYYTYLPIKIDLSKYSTGAGTWHACVFKDECGKTPSSRYPGDLDNTDPYFFSNGTTPNCNLDYVAECGFTVETSIPEFPSAAAPLAVAGLCAGIYSWLRKRQLDTPTA
jgi:hypothetical protein